VPLDVDLNLALKIALLGVLIALLKGVAIARRKVIARLLRRGDHAAYQTGDWPLVRSCVRWAQLVSSYPPDPRIALLESMSQRELGAPERSIAALMRRQKIGSMSPFNANLAVDMLISMGRYREALQVASPFLERLRGHADPVFAGMPVLVDINRAEAEYNLGMWAEAEARLEKSETRCDGSPICHAGSRLQRAWILAHRGRAEEALALCDETSLDDLPGVYQAEPHYSRAAALLALGRLDDAERAIEEGQSVAKRTSSERNGLFMLARVAARRERWSEVEALCRRASEHRWRYQGGEGLLLWGDALAKLGRVDEARAAWALVGERDPESESATLAAERTMIEPIASKECA
jgi:tetratricopeptide (TPR) repeat protein